MADNTKVISDKQNMSSIDNRTIPDVLISDETDSYIYTDSFDMSTNERELISKLPEEVQRLSDKPVATVIRQELIMIDDVMRTRLINNDPVNINQTLPMKHDASSASQISDDRLASSKALADNTGRESRTSEEAAALKLISNSNANNKPERNEPSTDKGRLTVKAKRPDVLTLSPVSPSDTDEDSKTPRPLSGIFRSADATPVSEFSFIELPLRFRQNPDDSHPNDVPEATLPDTLLPTSKYQYPVESRAARDELDRPDAHHTSRDVSDDITVALLWIQQELRQMKSSDRALVRQFLGIGACIHQLRGLSDCRSFNADESTERGGDRTPDWTTPVRERASDDLVILLTDPMSAQSEVMQRRNRRRVEALKGRRSLESVSSANWNDDDDSEFYI